MKKILLAALATLALAGLHAPAQTALFDFEDIPIWVGSGENQAAMVVQWNDGIQPAALVWGYRWDGAASSEDMFRAVAAADVGVFGVFKFYDGFGYNVDGIGFDTSGNGFSIAPSATFIDGIAEVPGSFVNGTSDDPSDRYRPGWDGTNFWGIYVSEGSPYGGSGIWNSSSVGISGHSLSDGSWSGFNYTFWGDGGPGIPLATVPEPSTFAFVAVGFLMLWRRFRMK